MGVEDLGANNTSTFQPFTVKSQMCISVASILIARFDSEFVLH